MNRLQRALREMLAIGIALAIVFCLTGRNVDGLDSLFEGLVFCPLVWIAYRLVRFVIFPLNIPSE